MTEWQILGDAIGVGLIDDFCGSEGTAALGPFRGHQMPFARAHAHDLARAGDLEPFSHRFPCFDTFRTTHNIFFVSKRARNIEDLREESSGFMR